MSRKFISQFKLVNKKEQQLRAQQETSALVAPAVVHRVPFHPSFKWSPAGGSSPAYYQHASNNAALNGHHSYSTPMLDGLTARPNAPSELPEEEDNFHSFTPKTFLPDNCPRPQQSSGRSFPAKSRHFDDGWHEWSVPTRPRRDISPASSSTSESLSPTFRNYDDGTAGKFHLSNGGLQLRRVRRSTTGSDPAFSDLLNLTNRKKPLDYLRKRASEVLGRSKRIASGQRLSIASGVCFAFNQDQYCPKGSLCRFTHGNQIQKEPLCARLLRGQCRMGSECSLSHELSDEQMPICDFFLRGTCTSYECPYVHVKFSDSAPLCKAFARGFCAEGRMCSRPHIYPPSLWRRRGVDAVDSRKRETRRRPIDQKSTVDGPSKKIKPFSSNNFEPSYKELPDFIPIQDWNDECYDESGDEKSNNDLS